MTRTNSELARTVGICGKIQTLLREIYIRWESMDLHTGRLATIGITIIGMFSATGVSPSHATRTPEADRAAERFEDVTASMKVDFQYVASHTSRKYLIETMGSGVALFDYDNDGRLDLYLVNGATLDDPSPKDSIPVKRGPKEWNRLYHQRPDGRFEDVTENAGLAGVGYGMGVAVGDYDNDGYEDLYVTAYGGNKLYHNNGDGTFTDVTAQAGVGGSGWSTSAAWVDLDNDGLLDLVVLRYMQWDFTDVWCGEHREGYRALLPSGFVQADHPSGLSQRREWAFYRGLQQDRHERAGKRPWGLRLRITTATDTSTCSLPTIPCLNFCIATWETARLKKRVLRRACRLTERATPSRAWAWISPTTTTMACPI